jgi:protoporphyrinogen oxidase
MTEIAIVGGGIAGLASAWRLLSLGHRVTLFEASDALGGLGGTFEHDGVRLERFYHVMIDSDVHLLPLVRALGLGPRIRWAQTDMGFVVGGRHYSLNTPGDILRFDALSWLDRLRLGLGGLYMTHGIRDGAFLDERPAAEWMPRVFGANVWRRIWEPLFAAKFGDHRAGVPVYWLWSRLKREKESASERMGYVRGGYGVIADALADGIRGRGGTIHLRSPVRGLAADPAGVTLDVDGARRRFDAAVSTLPLPLLARVAAPELAPRLPGRDVRYQGVVNVVVLLPRRITPHYWTAVVDTDGFPFQGVVETTHVVPPDSVGGRHLVHVMNYCGPGDEPYERPDDVLREQALSGLRRLYPATFRRADVEAVYVFRTPHVEPVWTLGFLGKRPPWQVDDTRLFLCTTAQAYPLSTSWNASVGLANRVVSVVDAALGGAVGSSAQAATN